MTEDEIGLILKAANYFAQKDVTMETHGHYHLQETEIQGSALQRQLSYGQTATDGAARTVSVPSLSKEVVNFLPDGGVLKLILLSSTDFSFVASRSL